MYVGYNTIPIDTYNYVVEIKNGEKEDPGNYRGIISSNFRHSVHFEEMFLNNRWLSKVLTAYAFECCREVFCKILNDCLVQYLDKSGKIHEGQAGFRAGRCCIDKIFTLNELILAT